ncbi:MAG: protein kinase [Pyrinomonadaceae bacterium]
MDSETKVGNYVIEKLIGRGGMGVVYRGRHATLPRVVAIKSISPRGRQDLRRMRQRFEREAFIQSQLDHPAIVKIYDYVVAEQTYFIIMEYVEGLSLAQLIERERGQLGVGRALDLFGRILEAVVYAHTFVYRDEAGAAHRGLIHRDLKPPNILVTPDDRVKITDFGIVKLVGGETSDTSGLAYGSPRYVSPEQARGETVDQRSDIYSLGVILYEMLTGQPPFGARTNAGEPQTRTSILRAHIEDSPRPPSELNASVTAEVEEVVLRALEKKPERRFASAADFYRALRRARGLDEGLLNDAPSPPQEAASESADDTGEGTRVTGDFARDSYHTQPIRLPACDACGTVASADEQVCRACGHDLVASPATAGLTRRQTTSRQRSRKILLGALLALVALGVPALYLIFRPGGDATRSGQNANVGGGREMVAPSPAKPADTSDKVTPVELVARAEVDSSYEGYSAAPLTDHVTDVRRIATLKYNKGNWVSAESQGPHWIELSFEHASRVTAVYVYWGFDRERFMPSRRVELQTTDGNGDWRTVSQLEAGGNYDRAAFEFEPLVTTRLRILQPAQAGPTNRPFVMWVREVQVFGNDVAALSR